MMRLSLLVLSVVVLSFSAGSNAVSCYSCSGGLSCNDPFLGYFTSDTCETYIVGSCAKLVVNGEVSRTCSPLCVSGCVGSICTYCCSSDKCNSATTVPYNAVLMVLALVLNVVLFRNY